MIRGATGLISCTLICKPRGSRVHELLNEWKIQGDEDWVTVWPIGGTPLINRQITKSNLFISINVLKENPSNYVVRLTEFIRLQYFTRQAMECLLTKSLKHFRGHPHSCANLAFFFFFWTAFNFVDNFWRTSLNSGFFIIFQSPSNYLNLLSQARSPRPLSL